ncbi:GntR family transcriptional regulator [Xanthobacter sp. KR7-225]|uniref:GntR family transcriptional regulator n=1 Tax=Xanthobacter sp. KR7-225 TaxID=3156613 RepID=UPI0032B55AD8
MRNASSENPKSSGPIAETSRPAMAPLHRYHHIYLLLRNRIIEGEFPFRSLLPGERQLAAEFEAARITVRTALEALERDGFITRKHGHGTEVVFRRKSGADDPRRSMNPFEGLMDSVLQMGLATSVRVLSAEIVEAPDDIARILRLMPGARVWRIVRLRLQGELPMARSLVYLPAHAIPELAVERLRTEPLLRILNEHGMQAAEAEEVLSAHNAELEMAENLGVPLSAALLSVKRVLKDEVGTPIQYFWGVFRPEYYEYRLRLTRESGRIQVQVSTDSPEE